MIFYFSSLSAALRYKLLIATVTPRPIALVTTRSRSAQDNAAPFSFFNVMGEAPPILVLGLKAHGDGRIKDTCRNIHETGEFVVHLVDESMRGNHLRHARAQRAFAQQNQAAVASEITGVPRSCATCARRVTARGETA